MSDEFNRRLGAIFVLQRHVEIINEANSLQFGVLRLELVLGSSIKVALNVLLGSLRVGTSREVDGERKLKLVEFSEKSLFNKDSLSDARVSNEKNMSIMLEESLRDESVSGPIDSLNVDVMELFSLEDLRLKHDIP